MTAPPGCPIGWQPTALAPVFYGHRDYDSTDGAPAAVRVFFPSLDGSPQHGEILSGCGRYPVLLFAHGHCDRDADHYLRWERLPAQLARSGYVVAVPQLTRVGSGSHPSGDTDSQATLAAMLSWLRQRWEHRQTLLPAPATGLAGHSYGALHAGILARTVPVAAVAYLSGVWSDWSTGQRPIHQLRVPQLFTWGTDPFSERDAILGSATWNAIAKPKHRAVFTDGAHFDYLYRPVLPCRSEKGPCRFMGAATDDLVTMFFARYLPPERATGLPARIPETLIPPALDDLTQEQEFYAGAHLIGLSQLRDETGCAVAISRELPTDRIVPSVVNTPRDFARSAVQRAGLVAQFTGPNSANTTVATQSPTGGRRVSAGSTVRMGLRTGQVP